MDRLLYPAWQQIRNRRANVVSQVDIFRKSINDPEDFAERCSTLCNSTAAAMMAPCPVNIRG
jgi:hypothetical protein